MNKNITLVLSIIILFLLSFIVIMFARQNLRSTLETFPYASYMQTPLAFSGNSYKLNAQIDSQLAYKDKVGRILLVKVGTDKLPLPIFVPSSLTSFNPMAGQKYELTITIDDKAKIILTNTKKL